MTTQTAPSLGRRRVTHELQARRAKVVEVTDLGARLRRVTLRLEDGAPPVPFTPLAVGAHVKIAFPHPETGELHLPTVVGDRPRQDENAPRAALRDYTVRTVPDERHVVIEFLLHGSGVASTWAAQATAGDSVGVLGPRGSVIEAEEATRYIVLSDESALPAVQRWLAEAPIRATLEVAVHVAAADGVIDLPPHPGATVTWLTGDDDALPAHLRGLTPASGDYLWAAGEAGAMVRVRRTAKDLGIGTPDAVQPSAVHIDGYWRRGVAGRDHHAPLDE